MPKKKKAVGKYNKKSPRIGFHEWNLTSIEEGSGELLDKAIKEALDEGVFKDAFNAGVEDLLNKALKEAMNIATAEYEVIAEFQIWKKQKDVATICVELPLGTGEYEGPRWEFKLVDLIADVIEGADDWDGDKKTSFVALRDRLRELADQLDKAINSPDKSPA